MPIASNNRVPLLPWKTCLVRSINACEYSEVIIGQMH